MSLVQVAKAFIPSPFWTLEVVPTQAGGRHAVGVGSSATRSHAHERERSEREKREREEGEANEEREREANEEREREAKEEREREAQEEREREKRERERGTGGKRERDIQGAGGTLHPPTLLGDKDPFAAIRRELPHRDRHSPMSVPLLEKLTFEVEYFRAI